MDELRGTIKLRDGGRGWVQMAAQCLLAKRCVASHPFSLSFSSKPALGRLTLPPTEWGEPCGQVKGCF